MNAIQLTDAALLQIITDLDTYLTTGPCEIGLFTGAPSLTNLTVLADLAALEPGYTGYAREPATPLALRRNAAGSYILPLTEVTFQPTAPGGTLPETVTGYFITDSGTPDLLVGAEYFDTPFTFVDILSGLSVKVDLMVQNITAYGGLCSTC